MDGEEALVYEDSSKRRRATELKPGGADEPVTVANVKEYLRLYARHRLLGAIEPQVRAFRAGLGVFFKEEILSNLRTCCSVAEIQLLLCGAAAIDVDDWKGSTVYDPPEYERSSTVTWLWKAVREMTPEERAQLLFFATGSTRPPATGFAHLMGYSGENLPSEQPFTVTRAAAAGRLPTASTCFNRLYLPEFDSEAQLLRMLRIALTENQGFSEAAVMA